MIGLWFIIKEASYLCSNHRGVRFGEGSPLIKFKTSGNLQAEKISPFDAVEGVPSVEGVPVAEGVPVIEGVPIEVATGMLDTIQKKQ